MRILFFFKRNPIASGVKWLGGSVANNALGWLVKHDVWRRSTMKSTEYLETVFGAAGPHISGSGNWPQGIDCRHLGS